MCPVRGVRPPGDRGACIIAALGFSCASRSVVEAAGEGAVRPYGFALANLPVGAGILVSILRV